jgi:hypothetical protein
MDSPVRPGLRLAHQDLVGHLGDASIFAHGTLHFLAETLPQGEYNPAGFLGAIWTVARRYSPECVERLSELVLPFLPESLVSAAW